MYLGYQGRNADDPAGQIQGFPYDGHLLTIGPTRSGKSRRLLIPNLLFETGRAMLVVDMKGELAAITAAHRAAKGGKVVALDPFGVLQSRGVRIPVVGFNPMAALDPKDDNFVDDAMVLAEAIIQVNPKDQNAYFTESAQDVACALIMLVKERDGVKANLKTVRALLCLTPKEVGQVCESAIANGNHPAIAAKLSKFKDASAESRELPAILSTAQTQTRFLDSPGITRSLAQSGLEFAELKRLPLTVFLVLPPDKLVTHAKWLRLVISSAMTAMQRAPKTGDRPDVLFMLDEFPQLGRMQPVEIAVSLNAGYGVKVWAAVQHLGQLKDLYGDNWETFLSAGCVTAFAPRDVFTRDHLTKLIGTGTKAMRSVSTGADGQTSVTRSVQKDDLMSPHQWRAMQMGDHFAFIPTPAGQAIEYLFAPDFTRLPDVRSGALKPQAA